jgi:hypothetical protein
MFLKQGRQWLTGSVNEEKKLNSNSFGDTIRI